jgi:hypothetical protein
MYLVCMYHASRSQWPHGLSHELSSPTRTVGSKPTRGVDVFVRLFCLCCPVCG